MQIRILFVAIVFSLGCGSAPKTVVQNPATEKTSQEAPVDLEECPCGRSDWEQLPPGHQKAPK